MTIAAQLTRLTELGVAELAGVSAADLAEQTSVLPNEPEAVLAIHPSLVPPSQLAGLLTRHNKPGFVVVDMPDLEQFTPIPTVEIPDHPLYLLHDVDRGDDMRNWSPDEALPAITGRGRTPLTINEGISWLLQKPELLEPNYCFMTIASRKLKGKGYDSRTPAIWISGRTGRDGKHNSGAPKVGWCWAGNRHTWLGFASARLRNGSTAAVSNR